MFKSWHVVAMPTKHGATSSSHAMNVFTSEVARAINYLYACIQSVLSNSPPVGKGSRGGLLERMDN